MGLTTFLKWVCIVLSLLTFSACSGGGSGEAPNISLSGSSYDFGGIALGSNSEKTITITNTTYGSLKFGTISTSGLPFSISSDTCSGHTWYKDGTCSLTVRFTPTTKGISTGSLSVSSNDPDQSTATVALSGKGTAPGISLSESSYDFGTIAVGNNSIKTITITNIGDASLIFGTISTSGAPFSISSDTCSGKTVAANGTCSLTTQFTPTGKGAFTGSLSIPSNDQDLSTATVPLSGSGSMAPNISLSESSYDFGGVVLNNSSDKTFVITNAGNAPLNIEAILLSGTTSSSFSLSSDTCSGKTVAANGTCSLTANFSPTVQASFTDTLISIRSDDPDHGTATISLTGKGNGLNVWINHVNIDPNTCVITVDVTVTDPVTGALLSLGADQFTLTENGLPLTPSSITSEVSSPVSLVLAIDWSGSVSNVLDTDIKPAAKDFIDHLKAGTDEAAVCKFGGIIDFNPAKTDSPLFYKADYSALTNIDTGYIYKSFDGSGGTKLYDAVYDSIDRAANGSNSKKTVVVLSDGAEDSSSSVHTLDEVNAHATEEGVPVFTIYYVDPAYSGVGYGAPDIMETMAKATGGQYYNGTTSIDLGTVYQQISNTLSNKYTISTPGNCAGTVSLTVQVDYNGLHGEDSRIITP